MANFLALPNELIEEIASYLPCSTVISLLRVCRKTNHGCRSRFLFQQIARNGLYNMDSVFSLLKFSHTLYYPTCFDTGRCWWRDESQYMLALSTQQTIHLAFAIEKLTLTLRAKDDRWALRQGKKDTGYECSDWLPHTLAINHPAAFCLKPSALIELQEALSIPFPKSSRPSWIKRLASKIRGNKDVNAAIMKRRWAEFININFALTYLMLQRDDFDPERKELAGSQQSVKIFLARLGWSGGKDFGDSDFISYISDQLSNRIPGYRLFEPKFTLTQAMALLPAFIIGTLAQYSGAAMPFPLPMPSKIPFSTFMDLPPMLSGKIKEFSQCHVRSMTTPEFLSSRTWVGYYSDQQDPSYTSYDSPLQNIRLVTRPRTAEDEVDRQDIVTIIENKSRGVGPNGEFMLQGHVRKDGSVRLKEVYIDQGWTWIWRCQMTPFGIVGVWGNGSMFKGYIWFWDEKWC